MHKARCWQEMENVKGKGQKMVLNISRELPKSRTSQPHSSQTYSEYSISAKIISKQICGKCSKDEGRLERDSLHDNIMWLHNILHR